MSSGQIIIIIGRIFYYLSAEILYNTVSKSKMISGGKEKACRERFQTVPYRCVEEADDAPGMRRGSLPGRLCQQR